MTSQSTRIDELDQYRDATISWWKTIDKTMSMYIASLANEKELRIVIRNQMERIEELEKILSMVEPEWETRFEKNREEKEESGSR